MRVASMQGIDDLQVVDVPEPQPGPGQVRVAIRSVGICGSDAAYLHHGRIGPWVVDGPLVLGHETSGVISAVGPGVSLEVGQRVAMEPGVPCRRCAQCRRGDYHLCPDLVFLATPPFDGCLAEHIVIDAACANPIPDSMSFDDAALVEPASVGLWAARRAGLRAGESVLVVGAGPVGILAALTARALGAGLVRISDLAPERLEVARRCGLEVDDGGAAHDVDVLVECSASADGLVAGLRRLAPGGRAALVGVPKGELVALPLGELVPREVSVLLVHRYAHTWPTVIDLIASGRVPTEHLVTHHFSLEETAAAFECQHSEPTAVKVMIHPGQPAA